MFGWFSKKQCITLGYAMYCSNAGPVKITEITSEFQKPCVWDDCEFVCEISSIDFIANFPAKEVAQELTEADFIEVREAVLSDATRPNAKQEWAQLFTSTVNSRQLFGHGTLLIDKHPAYFGSN